MRDARRGSGSARFDRGEAPEQDVLFELPSHLYRRSTRETLTLGARAAETTRYLDTNGGNVTPADHQRTI